MEFDWVDAFTDEPFGGNGCAVVYDDGALEREICMKLVRETSLVECTFVGPSDIADFKVRYFLADRELDFAGHPTIATITSLAQRNKLLSNSFSIETAAGLIPIEVDNVFDRPRIIMTLPAPIFGPEVPKQAVAAVGGISESQIISPPQVVSTGVPFVITVVDSIETLRSIKLDIPKYTQFVKHLEGHGVLAPFWVALSGISEVGDTYSRLLLAPPNPTEDPFTGAATGAFSAYLWAKDLIEDRNFIAEQGHDMGRPGMAQVQVLGPQNAISGVRLAGSGYVLMSGQLHL